MIYRIQAWDFYPIPSVIQPLSLKHKTSLSIYNIIKTENQSSFLFKANLGKLKKYIAIDTQGSKTKNHLDKVNDIPISQVITDFKSLAKMKALEIITDDNNIAITNFIDILLIMLFLQNKN